MPLQPLPGPPQTSQHQLSATRYRTQNTKKKLSSACCCCCCSHFCQVKTEETAEQFFFLPLQLFSTHRFLSPWRAPTPAPSPAVIEARVPIGEKSLTNRQSAVSESNCVRSPARDSEREAALAHREERFVCAGMSSSSGTACVCFELHRAEAYAARVRRYLRESFCTHQKEG